MSSRLLLFALLTSTPAAAEAQWSPDLREGARVRLELPEKQYQARGSRGQLVRGTVERLAPDTLYLRLGDSVGTIGIPRAFIRRAHVSRGVPSRLASAARSGVTTGVFTALFFVLTELDDTDQYSDSEKAAIGGAVGLVWGGAFGAIYPLERWKRLKLEPVAGVSGSGAFSLGVGFSW